MLSSNSYKTFENGHEKTSKYFSIIILALTASILYVGYAQAEQPERNKLIERVVDNWLEVAQTQCERAMYSQAEQSLARAQEYYELLNPKQRQSINDLLNEIHSAMAEGQQFQQQLDSIDEMINNNQLLQAKEELENLKKSKNLNETEHQQVLSILKNVDGKIETAKFEMEHLFEQSKQYYELGEIEKARAGFSVVAGSGFDVPSNGKTAKQYLEEIEKRQADKIASASGVDKSQPDTQKNIKSSGLFKSGKDKSHSEKESSKIIVVNKSKPSSPPALQDKGQIQVNRDQPESSKSSIRTSYAKAVVRDAHLKIGQYLAQNELGKAKSVLTETRASVKGFENNVDPQTYQQLMAEMDGLADMILKQQSTSKK